MSDQNTSLPVRTESAGDVISKIADKTIPSQQLAVDSAGLIGIKTSDGTGTAIGSNGTGNALNVYVASSASTVADLSTFTYGTTVETVVGGVFNDTGATVTSGKQAAVRITAQRAMHVNLRDSSGNELVGQKTSAASVPVTIASDQTAIPVFMTDSIGTEINNFLKSTAVAVAASVNHDYTVTSGKTLRMSQIDYAASGKMKVEVQVETGVAAGTFNTVFVRFNSTAEPSGTLMISQLITVAAGVRVRVIRTNLDLAAQDLYTTVCGYEV